MGDGWLLSKWWRGSFTTAGASRPGQLKNAGTRTPPSCSPALPPLKSAFEAGSFAPSARPPLAACSAGERAQVAKRALVSPPLSEVKKMSVLSRTPFFFKRRNFPPNLGVEPADHRRIRALVGVGKEIFKGVDLFMMLTTFGFSAAGGAARPALVFPKVQASTAAYASTRAQCTSGCCTIDRFPDYVVAMFPQRRHLTIHRQHWSGRTSSRFLQACIPLAVLEEIILGLCPFV